MSDIVRAMTTNRAVHASACYNLLTKRLERYNRAHPPRPAPVVAVVPVPAAGAALPATGAALPAAGAGRKTSGDPVKAAHRRPSGSSTAQPGQTPDQRPTMQVETLAS